jgi:hypothetical protein
MSNWNVDQNASRREELRPHYDKTFPIPTVQANAVVKTVEHKYRPCAMSCHRNVGMLTKTRHPIWRKYATADWDTASICLLRPLEKHLRKQKSKMRRNGVRHLAKCSGRMSKTASKGELRPHHDKTFHRTTVRPVKITVTASKRQKRVAMVSPMAK